MTRLTYLGVTALLSVIGAVAQPVTTKSFAPSTVLLGGATTVSFKITNPSTTTTLTGVAFTDTLTNGLVIANPTGITGSCNAGSSAVVTTIAGGTSIGFSGGTLTAPGSCQFSVNLVAPNTSVIINNTTGPVASSAGPGAAGTATLTVIALAPTLTKAFGAVSIGPGGTTTLTFTLNNPNTISLTGLSFADTLPGGLIVATPNGLTGSCDAGTITAVAGTNSIALAGATLAGGASCTFRVDVTALGTAIGLLTNTTGPVLIGQAVAGAVATASIFVGQPSNTTFASNLNIGDSVFNITNAGTTNTATGALTNICANVYTFSPDEQLVSCCSCVVTPNALISLSANSDLVSNTLTPAHPTSIVVKVVATVGPTCNAANATPANLANGLLAWGTTLHAAPTSPVSYQVTERPFSPASLSPADLTRITVLCGFIQANGSGFGICRSCRLGGLGASGQ